MDDGECSRNASHIDARAFEEEDKVLYKSSVGF